MVAYNSMESCEHTAFEVTWCHITVSIIEVDIVQR
jgi:hypothetical protein